MISSLRGLVFLSLLIPAGLACAQANVRTSFAPGRPTGPGQNFSIVVSVDGFPTVSGFNFRVAYNDSEMTLVSATDNTSHPASAVLYDLGPAGPSGNYPAGTDTYRNVLMSTGADIDNAFNLAELHFQTKPSFTGNFTIALEDAMPNDGLYDSSFLNMPHTFTTLDTQRPAVSSIVRRSGADQKTSVSAVVWRVTFSENVTGVDASDFALNAVAGSISGYAVSLVTGSGSVYDVTVNTGEGSGELRLDVPAIASISDTAGNRLNASYQSGETYVIEKAAPVIADASQMIAVTVSMETIISVSLDKGAWNIGTIQLNAETPPMLFTATNDGNVPSSFMIRATNASNNWNLGTQGTNTFQVDVVDPALTLTTTDQQLAASVAGNQTIPFEVIYKAPASDTQGGGKDHSFSITLTASVAP